MARVCTAGLADISLQAGPDGPLVQVTSDDPVRACLAAQYAGWAIDPKGYFAMGSGPARALARVERELFEKIGYAEAAERAATWTPPATLAVGAIRSERRLGSSRHRSAT